MKRFLVQHKCLSENEKREKKGKNNKRVKIKIDDKIDK